MVGRMVVDPAALADHAAQLGDLALRLAGDGDGLRAQVGFLAGRPDLPNGAAVSSALMSALTALQDASGLARQLSGGVQTFAGRVVDCDASLLRTGDGLVVRPLAVGQPLDLSVLGSAWDYGHVTSDVVGLPGTIGDILHGGPNAMQSLARGLGNGTRAGRLKGVLGALNSGDEQTIAALPGISKKGAAEIAAYTRGGGKITSLDDLKAALADGSRGRSAVDGLSNLINRPSASEKLATRIRDAGRASRETQLATRTTEGSGRLARALEAARGAGRSRFIPIVGGVVAIGDAGYQIATFGHHKVSSTVNLVGDTAAVYLSAVELGLVAEGVVVAAVPVAVVAGVVVIGVAIYDYHSQIWNGTKWVGNEIGDAGSWVGHETRDAASWVGDQAGDAASWTGHAAGSAASWTGHEAGEATHEAGHLAHGASHALGSAWHKVTPW